MNAKRWHDAVALEVAAEFQAWDAARQDQVNLTLEERQEWQRARNREKSRRAWLRIKADPERYEKHKAKKRREHQQRVADPAWREKRRETNRRHQRKRNKPRILRCAECAGHFIRHSHSYQRFCRPACRHRYWSKTYYARLKADPKLLEAEQDRKRAQERRRYAARRA